MYRGFKQPVRMIRQSQHGDNLRSLHPAQTFLAITSAPKSKNGRGLGIFIKVFRIRKCAKTLLLVFCKVETGVNMINMTG